MADLTTKLIQATFPGYPNGGSVPPGSWVTFHPSAPMLNTSTKQIEGADVIVPIDPVTGIMGFPDSIGGDPTQFGARLICNDDTNVKPVGTYWIVRVHIATQNWAEFAILVSTTDPDLLPLTEAAEITGATVGVALDEITSVDNSVTITAPRPGVRDLHVAGGGGGGGLGSATPLSDSGTGVVGTSVSGSHEDHQHPLDSAYATTGALTSEASTRATADSTHAALTTTAHGGIVASTDARLSDARTPTSHHTSHNTGGSDAMAPADIGAATSAALTSHTGNTSNPHGVTAAQLSDLLEAVQDIVGAMAVAGTGITVTYNDAAGTLTIAATGGGGGATLGANTFTDTQIINPPVGHKALILQPTDDPASTDPLVDFGNGAVFDGYQRFKGAGFGGTRWMDYSFTDYMLVVPGGIPIFQRDLTFDVNTHGPILLDRSNGHTYRLVSTGGVLGLEMVT